MRESFDKFRCPADGRCWGHVPAAWPSPWGPLSCRRTQAHIPYPSAAAAASESASGFLSHCCPGLQILRFLPKKQSTHRGESWRIPIRREGKRCLGSRIQSLPVFQDAMQMKKPPAGPWAVLWMGLGALLQTSLCKQWSGIMPLSPPRLCKSRVPNFTRKSITNTR